MGWENFHRRSEVLRTVCETSNRRCDGVLPTDLPEVRERFVDTGDLLAALQLRWYNRLSGAIDFELSKLPSDLEDAVVAAWSRTAHDDPGVRMILDAHMDAVRPAAARRKEWQLLAASAARATGTEEHTLTEGLRIEKRARRERGWYAVNHSLAHFHVPASATAL